MVNHDFVITIIDTRNPVSVKYGYLIGLTEEIAQVQLTIGAWPGNSPRVITACFNRKTGDSAWGDNNTNQLKLAAGEGEKLERLWRQAFEPRSQAAMDTGARGG